MIFARPLVAVRRPTLALLLCIVSLTAWNATRAQTGSMGASLAADQATLDPGLGITTYRLWAGRAPHAKADTAADTPTLTMLRPKAPNGTAVIVAPGGAYRALAANYEGRQEADFLTSLGVTAFVLKYRIGAANEYPIPLEDAQRALRLVRSMAATYKLDPNRIGFMGFSAGGHLAAETAVTPAPGDPNAADPIDKLSGQASFQILVYPWLNAMQAPMTNAQGKPWLYYCGVFPELPSADCKRFESEYTPALHVTHDTPPAFIFHTTTDQTVPVQTSVEYYSAMQKAGADAELHIFNHGPHGVGMGGPDQALMLWPALLEAWLRGHGWLTPPGK